jgi:hypothetical protein
LRARLNRPRRVDLPALARNDLGRARLEGGLTWLMRGVADPRLIAQSDTNRAMLDQIAYGRTDLVFEFPSSKSSVHFRVERSGKTKMIHAIRQRFVRVDPANGIVQRDLS